MCFLAHKICEYPAMDRCGSIALVQERYANLSAPDWTGRGKRRHEEVFGEHHDPAPLEGAPI